MPGKSFTKNLRYRRPYNNWRDMCLLIVWTLFAISGPGCFAAPSVGDRLSIDPASQAFTVSHDFLVKVRNPGETWKQVPAYEVPVSKGASMPAELSSEAPRVISTTFQRTTTSIASFEFSGEVEIAVTWKRGLPKETVVRPRALGLTATVVGSTLYLVLDRPRKLSVEINGDVFHSLQLFANAMETNRLLPTGDRTIYFSPGIYSVGTVRVPSDTTVYIAGGATVIGNFVLSHVQHVRITGSGIIASEKTVQPSIPKSLFKARPPNAGLAAPDLRRHDAILVEFSSDITIEGITEIPSGYSVLIGQSDNVTIRNLISFSAGGNNDGIDVFTSKHVVVDGVFMRNSDDCIAIYGHRWNYYGDTSDITVRNATLWADVAHPILVGTHGDPEHPDTLSELNFTNIDILDQREPQLDYQGCLSLNAGDSNLIKDVLFDRIRIEDIRMGQLVNIRVMFNRKYNTVPGRGIEDVIFRDVSYTGRHANPSLIAGYDEQRGVKRITFENLTINGLKIFDGMPGKPSFYKSSDLARIIVGEHVDGVVFRISANQEHNQ